MRGIHNKLRIIMLAALALGLVAGVGVATGAILDTGGVIHGCYKTGNGQLSVIDTAAGGTCNANQTALDWNKTGPQGPKGDTGAQGPRGPSDAFSATQGFTPIPHDAANPVTVDTLQLPAGKYGVTAKTVLNPNDVSGPRRVQCNLLDSAGTLVDDSQTTVDPAHSVVLAMQGTTSAASADTVSFTCDAFSSEPGSPNATSASIDAIQVAKINGS